MAGKKKWFFQEPTAAQIKKQNRIIELPKDTLLDAIMELGDEEAGIINIGRTIIPPGVSSRKFMKYGPTLKLQDSSSIDEVIGRDPVDLRRDAFQRTADDWNAVFRGYSFEPVSGKDHRTRTVSLVECVEGAKIYSYAHQDVPWFEANIDLEPYDSTRGAEIEGSEIIVLVPSRRIGERRYELKYLSVPTAENEEMWATAYNISTTHFCKRKQFRIMYQGEHDKESVKEVSFCAHDIAAYLEIMDFYMQPKNGRNKVPLKLNQFAIPTQSAVDFYDNLTHNILIQTPNDENPRKPNIAEKEVLLWGFAVVNGHDATFFSTKPLRDYKWKDQDKIPA